MDDLKTRAETTIKINTEECEMLISAVRILGETKRSDIRQLKDLLNRLEQSYTALTMHEADMQRWTDLKTA